MNDNVLSFRKDNSLYKKIAKEREEKGDLTGALQALFSAYKNDKNDVETISEIANIYADMGLLEQSNQYWFYYLRKARDKDKSKAYEELALNYFYLDNVWMSGYYFQEKVIADGFISEQALNAEIREFLSSGYLKKTQYKIVYPLDRADYSLEIKNGHRELVVGNVKEAIKTFSAIPIECLTEDGCTDLAMSYYLTEEYEKAKTVCKNYITVHGESILALGVLVTVYNSENNKDKSEYYYKKAKALASLSTEDAYKLAGSALEMKDFATAKTCLNIILKDKPFDCAMRFYYGLALFNLGEYQEGIEQVLNAYKICPDDEIYKFYAQYLRDINLLKDKDKFLPFTIDREYPKEILEKYEKLVDEATLSAQTFKKLKKRQDLVNALFWGVNCADDETSKKCALLIELSGIKNIKERLRAMLMRLDVPVQTKRLILFTILLVGDRERIYFVQSGYLVSVKHKKLLFNGNPEHATFMYAYALAVSKMVFWKEDCVDKLAFNANKVYTKLKTSDEWRDCSPVDIAVVIIDACGFEDFTGIKNLTAMLNADETKTLKLLKIIKGDKK